MSRADAYRLPNTIPVDCIGLADAFRLFVEAAYPRHDRKEPTPNELTLVEADQLNEELGEAERRFRKALAEKKIEAWFDGPDGKRRAAAAADWLGRNGDFENAIQGFRTNYVDGPSRLVLVPGPSSRSGVDKRQAPLFFDKSAYELWLGKQKERRISAADEARLPELIVDFYRRHPNVSRPEVESGLRKELRVQIPDSLFRDAFRKVPAQGKPGRKRRLELSGVADRAGDLRR